MTAFKLLGTKQYLGHRNNVSAVTWNLDGTRLAAAGDSSGILIWDTETLGSGSRSPRRCIHECRGHSKNIELVLASPTSPDIYASAGQDCQIHLYDVREGKGPVFAVSTDATCHFGEWTPDGNSMAIGTSKNNIFIVDCLSQRVSRKFTFEKEINKFRWSVDGKRLHVTSGDGSVLVYEWPSMKYQSPIKGHWKSCTGIACDPLGRFIAVTSQDTLVNVWDAKSLSNIFTIDRWTNPALQAEYSHDGQYLAVIGDSNHIEITDSTNGTLLHSIPLTTNASDIAWHPSKNLLAYSAVPMRYQPAKFEPPTCVFGDFSEAEDM